MGKKGKPKFVIGDTVVIKTYGTVGKITDIKWLDGVYIYEVNSGDGLFREDKLQLLAEYEDKALEKEQIDIEYRFYFGDIVQVKGYEIDLFKVVGFRTEIWRYKEDAWEDVIYELSRISDGEWLEASEEEISLVAEAEQAEKFIRELGYLYKMNTQKKMLELPEPKKVKELSELDQNKMIDTLLDIYNDYDILYKWFQDPEYEKIKKVLIHKLKKLTTNGNKNGHSNNGNENI